MALPDRIGRSCKTCSRATANLGGVCSRCLNGQPAKPKITGLHRIKQSKVDSGPRVYRWHGP